MKTRHILGAALAFSMALPALAQLGIYIGRTPPPLRYETRGPIPGRGYQWIDGYWGVRDGGYYWVPGRWDRPPYPGAYWSHPHYDHYDRGWQYHEGHWDHDDHGDHHDWDHDRDHGHR